MFWFWVVYHSWEKWLHLVAFKWGGYNHWMTIQSHHGVYWILIRRRGGGGGGKRENVDECPPQTQ